jgi:KDO2-lipid IV(A) lauroyltransferase
MRWRRTRFRNRIEFEVYRAARSAAWILGPRALEAVGGALGDLFRILGRRRGRILRFNQALAFPNLSEDARRRLEREVARHFARALLDALRAQRLAPEQLTAEVEVVGLEHVAAAVDHRRGHFLMTGHLGSWEVAALTIGLVCSKPLKMVNRPLDNPLLDAELARLRGRFGNLPLGKQNVARGILSELKVGGAVGILIDQRVSGDVGVEVPFFGQPTPTHPILAKMSLKTGAPVVPLVASRTGFGRYVLEFHEPIIPDRLPSDELDAVSLTARFSETLEQMIRRRPEQWLWYHDRWRHLRLRSGEEDAPTS